MDYYYSPRRKKPLRTAGHWIAVVIGSALVLFVLYKGTFAGYNWILTQPADEKNTDQIVFSVEKGESVRTIGAELKKEGIILSDTVFYLYVRSQEAGEKIKAGKFIVHKSDTIPQIVEILTGEATGEIVITIPEGWTIKDIQAALIERNIDSEKNFSTCAKNPTACGITGYAESLEGYLFPDTYFLDPTTFSAKSFIELLLATFDKKVRIGQSSRPLQDVLIMASIIEKEVATDDDRPIVAGILWKRLDNGWPLGADATLLYNDADGVIDAEDLTKDDPYNTRNRQGLPPTPICNPGLAAITAALTPQESPYWYYLTDSKGIMHYAITNEQHNANKAEYLN